MLTVIVLVYNHEKYIRQCLESVLNQDTKYSFEILIGEDASTDNTRVVLHNLEKEYKSKIKVFYRDINLGMSKNLYELCVKSSGKYMIWLDGDDYWLSKDKIQMQIDFLESNREYIAVAHKVQMVNGKGQNLPYHYLGDCNKKEYTLKEFRKEKLPGHTSTIMFRNNFFGKKISDYLPLIEYPCDRKLAFILAATGKIFCLDVVMSAYRQIVKEGSSFSANTEWRNSQKMNHILYTKYNYEYSIKQKMTKECIVISGQLYFRAALKDFVRRKPINERKKVINDFFTSKYKFSIWVWILMNCSYYGFILLYNKILEKRSHFLNEKYS